MGTDTKISLFIGDFIRWILFIILAPVIAGFVVIVYSIGYYGIFYALHEWSFWVLLLLGFILYGILQAIQGFIVYGITYLSSIIVRQSNISFRIICGLVCINLVLFGISFHQQMDGARWWMFLILWGIVINYVFNWFSLLITGLKNDEN